MRDPTDELDSACLSDETLAAWSSAALPASEREGAIEHAAKCSRCRAAIAALVTGAAEAPARLGRYEIEGPLGAGGMGIVLRGRDTRLGRPVAIKMIHAALIDPAHRDRMLREAQAMARISHPNVVTVHELAEAGDELFLVMGLVTGTPLHRWLAAARSAAARVAVARGVGQGVGAVHAAGLLHRDIKPDNVIVRDDDSPVLVDFGLAHAVGGRALGRGSARAGTPRYVAPEIVAGGAPTPASDQYQWWAIVQEALAGLPEARAAAQVIARGRDPDPSRRFADMAAALAALDGALAAPRRRRRRAMLMGAALVVAGAGAGVALWAPGEVAPACEPAAPEGWSAARRAAIADRLRAAEVDPARVLHALDSRVATMTELRAQACREGAGAAARAVWTRRQVCLDETWAAARRALTGLESPDSALVRDAIDELSEITPAERCARGSLPAIPAPLPPDGQERYDALARRIQSIEVDTHLPPTERTARLRALASEVSALDHPPLTARWHWALAHTLSDARDVDAAAVEFGRSAQAGLAAGEDDLYVRALISQLHVTPASASADHVAQLERQAQAGADRLGNPQIAAQLVLARANLQMERGDNAAARALFEEADRLYAAVSIEAHAMHVAVLQNLGALCLELGDAAAADGYLDRAVELARRRYTEAGAPYWEARAARATSYLFRGQLDDAEREMRAAADGMARVAGNSPQLGMMHAYLCAIALGAAEVERARGECAASVATMRAAIGADSAALVWPLTLSGQVELRAGDPAPALALLERAVALVDGGHVRPIEAATARAYLAIALQRAGRRRDAAALARQIAPALAGPELAEARADLLQAFPTLTDGR